MFDARAIVSCHNRSRLCRAVKEILGDALQSGDTVEIGYDKTNDDVTINKVAVPPDVKESKPAKKAKKTAAPPVDEIASEMAADDMEGDPPPPPPKKSGKGGGKAKPA